jgi:hypothetical protein
MLGMWKAFKAFWSTANTLSTAAWLWGFLPVGATVALDKA